MVLNSVRANFGTGKTRAGVKRPALNLGRRKRADKLPARRHEDSALELILAAPIQMFESFQ